MEHQRPKIQNNNFLYRGTWCIARSILDVLGHLEVHGNENVPTQGGVLLVSNHRSLIDPIVIGAAAPARASFSWGRYLLPHPMYRLVLHPVEWDTHKT